jgi:hypothetical protein
MIPQPFFPPRSAFMIIFHDTPPTRHRRAMSLVLSGNRAACCRPPTYAQTPTLLFHFLLLVFFFLFLFFFFNFFFSLFPVLPPRIPDGLSESLGLMGFIRSIASGRFGVAIWETARDISVAVDSGLYGLFGNGSSLSTASSSILSLFFHRYRLGAEACLALSVDFFFPRHF